MVATVIAFLAIQLGRVALVSTVFNTRPLIIFGLSLLAGHLLPGFITSEKLNRKEQVSKLMATLIVVLGLIAMLT